MINVVTKEQIESLFSGSEVEVMTLWDKTTVMSVKLPNGFVIVESSSCVDPTNYDEKIGYEICLQRVFNKLWELEGYKLQSELKGGEH
ncbi:Phage protein (N4 Gp49/phage Sf6 gene 66) family protein [Gracilibacillus orientalis]|uniref:Phage protein (N4 Gp49/phage Sf6 gene 66) family protein n=1 Tax=Gracilibacillus orientalis TaxID=334253 RepID=A0A1I4PMN9_9BACI|nr:Phage protein (N4 Gp49/phage Sf6 gene 66) family protein [Gracilibacillus orientalis]